MKRYGPDSLNSWIIACACCFINMMLFGIPRLSGMLFVASVPRFQVSRERASFPYSFSIFMRNASGPFVGYLGHKFGVRSVTTFGCIVASIGSGACYFAKNIDIVTVFWGVVFGLGFGLGNILLPVSINQYFDRHRATASGISFSGACLGSFALPPIVEILFNNYGLSGTYLLLSGFILNCVPAALLLKKPNFEINKCIHLSVKCENETDIKVSGTKVKLFTVEDRYKRDLVKLKELKNNNTAPNASEQQVQNSGSSYEEQMKRLTTQKLLSQFSIDMSTSEPSDMDQSTQKNKWRRQVNLNVLETEVDHVSSHNRDTVLKYGKGDPFQNNICSSNIQSGKKIINGIFSKFRTLSSYDLTSYETNAFKRNSLTGYQNYGYQYKIDDLKLIKATDHSLKSAQTYNARRNDSQSADNSETYSYSHQRNMNERKSSLENCRTNLNTPDISKSGQFTDIDNLKMSHGKLSLSSDRKFSNTDKNSALGSFSIIFDPMFIFIAITTAIYNFTFVCMFTIIVDFARDLNTGVSNEKYILMTLSVGDLIGRIGLGWITDGGFMTTANFAALCSAAQGVFTVAIVWSDGFITLLVLITLYGVTEAGIIVILPVIISQYIDPDKQTVAIPSSNFLTGPLCLTLAPLIGYFRDNIGSYDFIFFGIGLVSFLGCLSWLLVPCIARNRRNR